MQEEAEENSHNDGRTALHVAAASGNIQRVEELLNNEHTDMLNSAGT